jgi:hypothetical protein
MREKYDLELNHHATMKFLESSTQYTAPWIFTLEIPTVILTLPTQEHWKNSWVNVHVGEKFPLKILSVYMQFNVSYAVKYFSCQGRNFRSGNYRRLHKVEIFDTCHFYE